MKPGTGIADNCIADGLTKCTAECGLSPECGLNCGLGTNAQVWVVVHFGQYGDPAHG
jgi:hypothetical protein